MKTWILFLAILMYGCSTKMEVLYGPPVYYTDEPVIQIREAIPDSLARVMLFIQDTTVTSGMYYYIPNPDGSPSDSLSNEWIIQTPALWNRQDRFYDYQLRPYESKYVVLQFYQY